MVECIPSDGGCNWNVNTGDWSKVSLTTEEFPPLQLSGREIVLSLYSCSMRLFEHSLYLLNLKFNFVGLRYVHRVSEYFLL
jgi:hypothetical protein